MEPVLPKTVMAFAKVNLSLCVGRRRSDGLHEIRSIFQSVSLADELVFEENRTGEKDVVICQGVDGPNTVDKALARFRGQTGWAGPALKVSITKRIPVAAGLGGGSADAAATLRTVNEIAGVPLDIDGLRLLGSEIGADVPSQIKPGLYIVSGAGEMLEERTLGTELGLVLVPGKSRLSTADVYRAFDRSGKHSERSLPDRTNHLRNDLNLSLLVSETNELEPTVTEMAPEVLETMDELKRAGALAARVTGSGPTTFGIFESFGTAELAAEKLEASGAVAVTPVGAGSVKR